MSAIGVVIGEEAVKALVIILIQELLRRGMTAEQMDALYASVKDEFLKNNPEV